MQTRFGRWLQRHGESPCGFAEKRGYNIVAVRRLLGVGHAPYRIRHWREEFLLLISGETGISVATLKRDALACADNPVPPRSWRRRSEEAKDGAEAAE